MVEGSKGEAYLLVDVGHVLTHAAYVARVEGVARLVAVAEASTTRTAVEGGLLDGVRRATASLELLAGRQILDRLGEVRRPSDGDGHGVDGVVVTTSLAPLLRVALVGLTEDFSLASAVRAATLPCVSLERAISLGLAERWQAADIEALLQRPPDVLVLVGGADGGPVAPLREMGETLGTAYSLLPPERRPTVVFAGNDRAYKPVAAAFAGVVEVTAVANVRPAPHKENLGGLQAELARLFGGRLCRPAGLQQLAGWAGAVPRHDLDALARTLRFVARRHSLRRGLLGVDAGANSSRALWVRPEGAALTWAAPYGVGAGLGALRALGDPTAVVRWMCRPPSWAEVWDNLSNVEVRPGVVPETDEDWDLQQAAVREALGRTWAGAHAAWAGWPGEGAAAGEAEMIVARGTVFSHARTPAQAALMLLDALEPAGLVRLALDWANLLPGLSGLAALDPEAAVQVFDNDGLLELGTLVAPRGWLREGARALRLRLLVGGEERAQVEVRAGHLCRVPLGTNERGRLELYPARGLDVGLGRRGRGGAVEVRGGALGVIVDARGRPLRLPSGDEVRSAAFEAWQQEIDTP